MNFRAARLTAMLLLIGLGGCFGGDGCDPEERAAFDAIDHFADGLAAEDHPYGTCAATFSAADGDAVMDHYRVALVDAGYEVSSPETFPIMDGARGPVGRTLELNAQSVSMGASVSGELIEGAEPIFAIHVSHRPEGG
jgi:hypothetical protein